MSFSKYQQWIVLASILVVAMANGCQKNYWPGPDVIDEGALSAEFNETQSGLRYRILRRSSGKRPTPQSKVSVHYRGWLEDETIFDSSYEIGMSSVFIVEQTLLGWSEGLQFIGEGGMIELVIPPELAYGEKGNPPIIPPNETLRFRVELIHVE